MVGGEQKKNISVLLLEKEKLVSTITSLEKEVTLLNSKHENMTKYVRMLHKGSNMLDEILEVGKMYRNVKGIWFDCRSMGKDSKVPTNMFVLPEKITEFMMEDHMSQQLARHMYPKYMGNKNSYFKYHYCG